MRILEAIFSDPAILIAASIVALGFFSAILRIPKNPMSRKYTVWFLWFACFAVIATWTMRQQDNVLAGGTIQSPEQPIAVAIKGTVRYVSEELAYRHESGMWVLLAALLMFAAIQKVAAVQNEA